MADPPSYEEALRMDSDVIVTFSPPSVAPSAPLASFESLASSSLNEIMAEPDNNNRLWNRTGRRLARYQQSSANYVNPEQAASVFVVNGKQQSKKRQRKRTCGCFNLLIVNVFGP
jgi:hypothetical protein